MASGVVGEEVRNKQVILKDYVFGFPKESDMQVINGTVKLISEASRGVPWNGSEEPLLVLWSLHAYPDDKSWRSKRVYLLYSCLCKLSLSLSLSLCFLGFTSSMLGTTVGIWIIIAVILIE